MNLARVSFPILLVTACLPGSKSLGEGQTTTATESGEESDGSEGDSNPSQSSTSPTQTTTQTTEPSTSITTTAETGGECGPNPCGPCEPGCEADDECVDGEWQCSCLCPDTEPTGCPPFEEYVCDVAEMSKQLPQDIIDCGYVTLADTAEEWGAAQLCALDALDVQTGFKVIADIQGIDSFPATAFVGAVGAFYQRSLLSYDAGGVVQGSVTWRAECTEILPIADCVPLPGNLCLECAPTPEEFETVCDDVI